MSMWTNTEGFNTQPPEGGWYARHRQATDGFRFQHTAARRRLVEILFDDLNEEKVSTHSRPKAAGAVVAAFIMFSSSFNTQPPEGGWQTSIDRRSKKTSFNTQPPEGGWIRRIQGKLSRSKFQHTAARRRLAQLQFQPNPINRFQHTAARRRLAWLPARIQS